MTNRLFIALKLPLEVREEIVSITRQVYRGTGNLKWEPVEKLHLTVKFLGSVDESRTNEISNLLTDCAEGFSKIKASYDRFGFFLPRILWVSLKTENHLFQLVERIEEQFSGIGFEKEKRRFKSHITLLRMKEEPGPSFIDAFRNYTLPQREFEITEAALIKSTLKPSGSVYTDIQKIIFA